MTNLQRIATAATVLILAGLTQVEAQDFIRGDIDVSGAVDLTDPLLTLEFLFLGTGSVACRKAGDSNDDGALDLTDPIFTLEFLFLGLADIPAPNACGSDPTLDTLTCESFLICAPTELTHRQQIGHLLNRIAYGPTVADVQHVTDIGISAYIHEQLDPAGIPENPELLDALDDLMEERFAFVDEDLAPEGGLWHYWKGRSAPGAGWNSDLNFDTSGWTQGHGPIGYDEEPDYFIITRLDDMKDPSTGYDSVFMRKIFNVDDPGALNSLRIAVNFDDGFRAYINGTTIESVNLNGALHTDLATANHEAESLEEYDISDHLNALVPGENVLALQVHNLTRDSSDFIADMRLFTRTFPSAIPFAIEYPTLDSVKAALHLRGIYSTRRLQVVLADFWENHFTTDGEKVRDYFRDLENSSGERAMSDAQAEREAATLEAKEYEFFLENALGNFGDLLRYNAKSPTMLIYLDNVLNFKGNPNENYSREILELHTYGVDNGYIQRDIEEGARLFTGWNVCKVTPENVDNPHASCGQNFTDTTIMDLGAIKYFKGTTNPTEVGPGEPTTEWTELDYNDDSWLDGITGIGYGYGHHNTHLGDMHGGYISVYLRQEFTITDFGPFDNLFLSVGFDDGFVAYLNGVEVARSGGMENTGMPPNYDQASLANHGNNGEELFELTKAMHSLFIEGTNVLAIQVHNNDIASSGLSMAPRIFGRFFEPGSMESGDLNGVWAFSFQSDQHDNSAKILFNLRPYQFNVSEHSGADPTVGVLEGDDFIDQLVDAPPTAEFICTKLVQKLLDDRAPPAVVAEAIAAWNSTTPKGNIRNVVEAILTSDSFFDPEYYRTKVKDPVEFVNSSARALEATIEGFEVIEPTFNMDMHLFTRDDPDGWPEGGADWSSVGGVMYRIRFTQSLGGTADAISWPTQALLADNGVASAEEIIGFFNDLLFDGTLTTSQEQMLVRYVETNSRHLRVVLVPGSVIYELQVRSVVALMLSLPQWNFQ
jgi:hypothetical protein